MTKLVIDTNIFISALIKENSGARKAIMLDDYDLIAPNFMISEVLKHIDVIFKKSKLSKIDTLEIFTLLTENIDFIKPKEIFFASYLKAFNLCKDVDEKDTPFVALAIHEKIKLWTRDDELKRGLTKKGWNNFFDESLF